MKMLVLISALIFSVAGRAETLCTNPGDASKNHGANFMYFSHDDCRPTSDGVNGMVRYKYTLSKKQGDICEYTSVGPYGNGAKLVCETKLTRKELLAKIKNNPGSLQRSANLRSLYQRLTDEGKKVQDVAIQPDDQPPASQQ
jgi:hypothetical protein